MKYIKGLIKRKLNDWTGKQWYHQRFDGAPYLIHMIGEAQTVVDIEKKQGGNFTVHYCFFVDGKADWYMELEDIKRVYTTIIKAGKKESDISARLMNNWEPQRKVFFKKSLEIGKIDLSKLSSEELINLHDEYLEIILQQNSSSSIIDGFALGTDEIVAEMIQDGYDKSEFKDQMRFSEMFSTLTAPVHLSFINQAEIDLLKTALAIKNGGDRNKLLIEHQQRYFWIKNNYTESHIVSVKDFNQEVDKILSLNIDIKKQIEDIKNTPTKNKQAKADLMSKLNLDKELKMLLKISEDFTHWQDQRKEVTFWTAHYAYLILHEIGKRVKLDIDELKYLSPREVSRVFIDRPSREMLEERRKGCVQYWDMEGHEILSGKDYHRVMNAILGNEDLSDVDDFRGLTASMGKARGKVKVLQTVKDIGKVEEGDILVAVMTRPDYVPAIKRAAAIVTNEGGITCHAAIISRELGIPCIIGTKIATKILKDGMEVEVNANHGWVRIIK